MSDDPSKRQVDGTFGEGNKASPGVSKHQASRRAAMLAWIASEPVDAAFKKSYLAKLEEGDTTVLIDCANRLMGKVKEKVEVSGEEGRPLLGLTAADILAALKAKP